MDAVSKEWLQSQLRAPTKSLIVLDCRSSNEYLECHIRSAVNFSIPSLILKRLSTGKIDLMSTIKCRDLKQRIQTAYTDSIFILYNEACMTTREDAQSSMIVAGSSSNIALDQSPAIQCDSSMEANTISILHRRLKQDGCNVYWLKGKYIQLYT